jgi:hypothetical protein
MAERDDDVVEEWEDLSPLMDRFKPHLGYSIDHAIKGVSSDGGVRRDVAARELYKLSQGGLVKLIEPEPPLSLSRYLFSLHSLWFWVMFILVILTVSSVYLLPATYPLSLMRGGVSMIFLLYLPGYALIEALYPMKDDLERIERLALSVGLSLAVVPLVGLALNYTPLGIRLDPYLVILVAITVILGLVAVYRKYTYWKLGNINA